MSVTQRQVSAGVWLVGISGRLDQGQTPDLEANLIGLLDEGQSRLVVNLADVTYVNSGGLRCLVTAWRRARQVEGDLVLCGLTPRLSELFQMVGFDKVFAIYESCEAALSALRGS